MNLIDLPCKLLCASAAAYCIPTSATNAIKNYCGNTNKQYNAIGFIATTHVVVAEQINAALVGKTNSEVIIAFRGTLPPALHWDTFLDWLQDFWAEPTTNINLPGKVHAGFLNAVLSLSEGISKAVKAIDPKNELPVYITGHSKGGGMAPIAAMYLKNTANINIKQVITFAGPNAGNNEFCEAYNNTFPNHLRYENYLDLVPLLPPTTELIAVLDSIHSVPNWLKDLLNKSKDWNYQTVGTLNYINADAQVKAYSKLRTELLLPIRIGEILQKLGGLHFKPIAEAHHASCDYRYMKGTCNGTVCK